MSGGSYHGTEIETWGQETTEFQITNLYFISTHIPLSANYNRIHYFIITCTGHDLFVSYPNRLALAPDEI